MKPYLSNNKIIKLSKLLGIKFKQFIEPQIKLENSSVLEIGAGNGLMTYSLAPFTKLYTAIEPSEHMIKSGRELNKNYFKLKNVEWIKGKGEDLSKNLYNKYDLVIFLHSFHFLSDYNKGLNKALLALKPNGLLWIIEPNKKFAVSTLQPDHKDFNEKMYNDKREILKQARHFLKSEATKDLQILHYSKKDDKVMFVFKK